MTTKSSTLSRLHGFDLIRMTAMIAIVVLHTNEAIFWTDLHPLPTDFSIYRLVLSFAQTITYSGFTVIALSFFLLGKGSNRNFISLLGFLGFGILTLASFQADPPFTGFYWEWDIYWFLLASLFLIQLIAKLPRLHFFLAPLSFLFTLIPFWEFVPQDTSVLSQALVGICPPQGSGSWPLLPWASWPLLFFCFGSIYRQSNSLQKRMQGISKIELAGWITLLLASIPFWGAYYGVPIGPNFYCYTLRQPPHIFWAHFIWIVFFMRISLIQNVNMWLAKWQGVQWISSLAWNRHFGATYLAHLPLLGLGIMMANTFWKWPFLFDLYFIAVMPTAEIIVRTFFRIKKITLKKA